MWMRLDVAGAQFAVCTGGWFSCSMMTLSEALATCEREGSAHDPPQGMVAGNPAGCCLAALEPGGFASPPSDGFALLVDRSTDHRHCMPFEPWRGRLHMHTGPRCDMVAGTVGIAPRAPAALKFFTSSDFTVPRFAMVWCGI
jgi:hypothetical protein